MKNDNLDIKKIREMILLSDEKIWGITSVKERTGKTYIAGMVAEELNKIGKHTLLFTLGDSGLDGNCLAFEEPEEVESMLQEKKENKLCHICMNNPDKIDTFVFHGKMEKLLEVCRHQYDYVIVDTKSIENSGFSKSVCMACDENLIVVSKDVEDGVETGKKIRQLQEIGVKVSGIIMNEYHDKKIMLKM